MWTPSPTFVCYTLMVSCTQCHSAPVHYELISMCVPCATECFRKRDWAQWGGRASGLRCIHCDVPVQSPPHGRPVLRCPDCRRRFESIRKACYRRLAAKTPEYRVKDIARAQNRRKIYVESCLTTEDVLSVLGRGSCEYCGSTKRLTVEHHVPLSRGGLHEMSNLRCLCLSCNSSKGPKLFEEWRPVESGCNDSPIDPSIPFAVSQIS